MSIDVTEATFESDVIEASKAAPVVVDFWATWCAPCRALTPVLEKLATEADGTWTLAKLDIDSNQNIAGAFGIQSIPAVKAFKDGELVAEFTGALGEAQVRQWLQQLGPTQGDLAFEEGSLLERSGDLDAAARGYKRVLEAEPGHLEARRALARVELRLRSTAADEDTLRRRLESAPSDLDAAMSLADLLAARGDYGGAFDLLIRAVTATAGDDRDRVRAHAVLLLDTLPADDARAMSARRELSRALF